MTALLRYLRSLAAGFVHDLALVTRTGGLSLISGPPAAGGKVIPRRPFDGEQCVVISPARYWVPPQVLEHYGVEFIEALHPNSIRVDHPSELGLYTPRSWL